MILSAAAQLFIELSFQPILHEFRDHFPEQLLDVVHAAHSTELQNLSDLIAAFIFFRCSIPLPSSIPPSCAFIIHIFRVYARLGMASYCHFSISAHGISCSLKSRLIGCVATSKPTAVIADSVVLYSHSRADDHNSRSYPRVKFGQLL